MKNRSRKTWVLLAALLVLWLSYTVQGSRALLSASASLTSNTISTGSANLLVSNSQNSSSTIYDTERPGFSFQINPGESVDKFFLLKNASVADVPLEVAVSVPPAMLGSGMFPDSLSIEIVPVDADGQPIQDAVTARSSLADLMLKPQILDGEIAHSATKRYRLRTILSQNYDTPNSSVSYDLVLTGTQKL